VLETAVGFGEVPQAQPPCPHRLAGSRAGGCRGDAEHHLGGDASARLGGCRSRARRAQPSELLSAEKEGAKVNRFPSDKHIFDAFRRRGSLCAQLRALSAAPGRAGVPPAQHPALAALRPAARSQSPAAPAVYFEVSYKTA